MPKQADRVNICLEEDLEDQVTSCSHKKHRTKHVYNVKGFQNESA